MGSAGLLALFCSDLLTSVLFGFILLQIKKTQAVSFALHGLEIPQPFSLLHGKPAWFEAVTHLLFLFLCYSTCWYFVIRFRKSIIFNNLVTGILVTLTILSLAYNNICTEDSPNLTRMPLFRHLVCDPSSVETHLYTQLSEVRRSIFQKWYISLLALQIRRILGGSLTGTTSLVWRAACHRWAGILMTPLRFWKTAQ